MSKDTNETAAFPQMRANKLGQRKAIWLMALFGVMVSAILGGVVGGFAGYHEARSGIAFGTRTAPWALFVAALVGGFASMAWSLKYWRAIDEMARRAHLDSWFWGGVLGSIPLGTFGIVAMAFPNFNLGLIDDITASPTHAFGLGIVALYGSMLFGYTLFWLIWWAKKR
jgi:hypothetical protein